MEAQPPEESYPLMRFRGKLVSYRPGNHSWPINMAEKISWGYRAFAGPLIKIYLPKHGKVFMLHRKILETRCHLVEELLTKAGFEDSDMLALPHGSPQSFGIIVKWLYTSSVHFLKDESEAVAGIEATNLAHILGIWDVLDPLCDRVAKFYEHNDIDIAAMKAFTLLPNDCELHGSLFGIVSREIHRITTKGQGGRLLKSDRVRRKIRASIFEIVQVLADKHDDIFSVSEDEDELWDATSEQESTEMAPMLPAQNIEDRSSSKGNANKVEKASRKKNKKRGKNKKKTQNLIESGAASAVDTHTGNHYQGKK